MKKNTDLIAIIAQHFYGNLTGTEIRREHINHSLVGNLNPKLFPNDDKDVVRKVIHLPGAEHIVVLYDQTQEDRYVNVSFPECYARDAEEYRKHTGRELKMQVSCVIPELDITLHTRCIACRMNENGEPEDIRPEDFDIVARYFTA